MVADRVVVDQVRLPASQAHPATGPEPGGSKAAGKGPAKPSSRGSERSAFLQDRRTSLAPAYADFDAVSLRRDTLIWKSLASTLGGQALHAPYDSDDSP